jgi:uncharacterized integral membrane protein (TIGR00698 family)
VLTARRVAALPATPSSPAPLPPTPPPPPPSPPGFRADWRHGLLLAGAVFALTPWATPELGLALGLAIGLIGLMPGGPAASLARKGSRWLIQIAVVLLGFRMDLHKVASAGSVGLGLAVGVVLVTFALGILLGRVLRTRRELTALISSGTAICGGSAIAAVGSTIGAAGASISVAVGVVFILNAVSLFVFPQLGELLNMTPRQFGAWAGIAIHDVSSVVGAASSYRRGTEDGAIALEMATIVKLSRVLWIAPVCLIAAWIFAPAQPQGESARKPISKRIPTVPWYIPLFLVAAAVRTFIPQIAEAAPEILLVAKRGMTLALFLIGAGLSRQALASVGWRPLVQSVILWIVIAAGTLVAVLALFE